MRMHKILAATAAAVMVAGLGVAGAAPASAAPADPAATTLDCESDINGVNDRTITGAVGDTFTLTAPPDVLCGISSTVTTRRDVTYAGYGGIVTVTGTIKVFGIYEAIYSGDATFTIVGRGSFTVSHGTDFRDHSSTITVRLPGDPPAPVPAAVAAADAPPIPAWVQAYGRASADATCLDGWDASWQPWAEPVTGGWVCTRGIPSAG